MRKPNRTSSKRDDLERFLVSLLTLVFFLIVGATAPLEAGGREASPGGPDCPSVARSFDPAGGAGRICRVPPPPSQPPGLF